MTVCLVIVAANDDDSLSELGDIKAVLIGAKWEDFVGKEGVLASATVLLNCNGGATLLQQLWPLMPKLQWIHSRSAGVEHMLFDNLVQSKVLLTNARGLFSSSLAEYAMLAALYFAKDVDRLKRQQRESLWHKFAITELRGQTFGVVGYGDIGMAAARLAKAFGMRVVAQRRRPELCDGDGICDRAFGSDGVGDCIAESDYILVAAALTPETKGMIGAGELARAKPSAVLINLGRGPLVDEAALMKALQDGKLRGAALDVFDQEPLPSSHIFWGMEQVLLSPHNADMTATFLHESVRAFAAAVPRFERGEPLGVYEVDKTLRY